VGPVCSGVVKMSRSQINPTTQYSYLSFTNILFALVAEEDFIYWENDVDCCCGCDGKSGRGCSGFVLEKRIFCEVRPSRRMIR
jgi:hypothetical protein